ncbi:MAG: hypothetical protein KDH17_15900 [Rhodocyclaceae bacterium]|nr:hypothetical protein [Rhodocyclaceae bacterium]
MTKRRLPLRSTLARVPGAGRLALVLAMLWLLVQAMPLAHAVLQHFDPLIGDVCIASAATDDGGPAGSGHDAGCGTCCCGGTSPPTDEAISGARFPTAPSLALRPDAAAATPIGADHARPWSRGPPATR